MPSRLVTTPSRDMADVKAFFDAFAARNVEQHGPADRLLAYRLGLLAAAVDLRPTDRVLDVGCGNGHHLFALEGRVASGVGVDVSDAMIEAAQARLASLPEPVPLRFLVDDARRLRSQPDHAVDVVTCIGSLEHMIDQRAVFAQFARVLRPGGRLFVLTVNGGYVWHTRVAPLLGMDTRHLATDRFLRPGELRELAVEAGFASIRVKPWSFVPRGDVPPGWRPVLGALDRLGRLLRLTALRGGLMLTARRTGARSPTAR